MQIAEWLIILQVDRLHWNMNPIEGDARKKDIIQAGVINKRSKQFNSSNNSNSNNHRFISEVTIIPLVLQ